MRMRRLVSVSAEKNTVLPSKKNLERPSGASFRWRSQYPYGSRTMSTMLPTSGTNRPSWQGTPGAVHRNCSCSSTQ